MSLITVADAATRLAISKRKMYELAAPNGPIPCHRYGSKCIRFDEEDLFEYKEKCRFITVKAAVAGALSSTKLSMDTASGLLKRFQKAGANPRLTPSTKRKQTGSTALRLVQHKTAQP